MNFDSDIKKEYYPPEIDFIIYDLKDTLLGSQPEGGDDWNDIGLWEDDNFSSGGDANTDHNDIGSGDDLSDDNSDLDANNDYYDLGDGDGLLN